MDVTTNINIDPIEIELQIILPIGGTLPFIPYENDADTSTKIQQTVRALRRSIELKNRLRTLINAFYLGQIFNDNTISVSEKFRRKQNISRHYVTMADKMYDVFESSPTIIMGTLNITAQEVRRWKKHQILKYRSIIEQRNNLNFAGAQDLEEETVTR